MQTRSRGAAARAGGLEPGVQAALLLLTLVALAMRLLASPAARHDAEAREAVQRIARVLFAMFLRMAFRNGLKAGRALLGMLRGTAWEDHLALVERVANGRAEPEALPGLDPQSAARLAGRLGRWARRASRRLARRAHTRRVAARLSVPCRHRSGARTTARRAAPLRERVEVRARGGARREKCPGRNAPLRANIVTMSQ